MELLVIRHGETVANTKNHYYGFTDSLLTKKGEEQAKTLGKILKKMDYTPDKIFVSKLKRTHLTLENMGFDIENATVDERINEQNMGVFEDMLYEEIGKKFPKEFKQWNEDFLNYLIPKGESKYDQYLRVKSFFEEVTLKYKETDEKIMVICHGGVLAAFYTYLIGENFKETYSAFFGNCAMLKVKYMSGKLVINSLFSIDDFIKVLK